MINELIEIDFTACKGGTRKYFVREEEGGREGAGKSSKRTFLREGQLPLKTQESVESKDSERLRINSEGR